MTNDEKHARLREISQEADLRELLMDLFERMGLEPVLTHGPRERGKDIVCKETSNSLGAPEWIGCVVKQGNITGATSGNASSQTILNQVQEVFIHPYFDNKTKQRAPINKAFVVNNGDILETARDKIREKISALYGSGSANIHFIDATRLVELIDKHWPKFWDAHSDSLGLNDPMSPEIGKTLYVVARAYSNHERRTKKKSAFMSKSDIIKQTGLPDAKVERALKYLVDLRYLDPPSGNDYTLHRKLTAGRLLTNTNHINLLFLLEKRANPTRYLSAKQAKKAAKKSLGFLPNYVQEAMGLLVDGGYVEVDISHGTKNHYRINDGMIQDERTYLEAWLEHSGRVPQSGTK